VKYFIYFLLFFGIGCSLNTGPEYVEVLKPEVNALIYLLPGDEVSTTVVISSDIKIDSNIQITVPDTLKKYRQLFYVTLRKFDHSYHVVTLEKKLHKIHYAEISNGVLVAIKDSLICFNRNVYKYADFLKESKINVTNSFSIGDTVVYIASNDTLNAIMMKNYND